MHDQRGTGWNGAGAGECEPDKSKTTNKPMVMRTLALAGAASDTAKRAPSDAASQRHSAAWRADVLPKRIAIPDCVLNPQDEKSLARVWFKCPGARADGIVNALGQCPLVPLPGGGGERA